MSQSPFTFGVAGAALWLGATATALAQSPSSPPPPESVKAECTSLKGQSKVECEKVATKMDESAAKGEGETTRPTEKAEPDSQHLHHSSPIMVTPEEKVVANAEKQGKDPKQALEKLHERNRKAAEKNVQPQRSN